MTSKHLLSLAAGTVFLLAGCYNDNRETLYPVTGGCDTAGVTYNGTIKTLTLQNCAFAGCHAGATPSAGLDLSTYAGLKVIAEGGSLLSSIRHESGYSPMPKGAAKLSDCVISQYAAWVNAGTPEN